MNQLVPTSAADLASRARLLGVSPAALELLERSLVLDLHVDTFIPVRLWGYDPLRRHGPGLLAGRFFGHLDLPRLHDCGVDAAMWSITTNPFRTAAGRWRTWQRNLSRLQGLVAGSGDRLRFVRTAADLEAARAAGRHAVLLAVQGGNAFDAAPDLDAAFADGLLTRVTLVHLTDSALGGTSSPLRLPRHRGLTDQGRAFVQKLNAHRIFVDLAHAAPRTFWDAVEVHDARQPLIATHTGVSGVRSHWRNLDDRQLRAIADSGGVVGVIFASVFLARAGGPRDAIMVAEHLEHIARVCGDDVPALGSDYDGAIVPPQGMRDGLGYARLVQALLDRGWSDERIAKVLGLNALAALRRLRPAG